MAVIVPTVAPIGRGDGSTMLVTWTPVTNADTCGAVSFPDATERSIQVSGTFGSSSTAVTGSNNGSTYVSLNDSTKTVIAITVAAVQKVLESTVYTVPLVTGGGGTQSLTIAMLFHGVTRK